MPPEQLEEETLERTARLELSDALDLSERTVSKSIFDLL